MLKIYRASAGSGKTYTLAKDYISLLFRAAQQTEHAHRRILAVTFTNKATEEMKSRILKELYTLFRGEKSAYRGDLIAELGMDERGINRRAGAILTRILHDYSNFHISTIDKFFQQVVRSFAREIGVSGGYNLELDVEVTLQQAVDNLYMSIAEKGNESLLNWMTSFMEEQVESAKSWNLQQVITELGKEIFKESYQCKYEGIRNKLHDKDFLKNYQTKLRQVKKGFEKQMSAIAEAALDELKNNGLRAEYFSREMMYKTLEGIKNGNFELKNTFLNYAQSHEKCYTAKQEQSIKQAIERVYYSGLQDKIKAIIRLTSSDEMRYYNTADIVLKHIATLGVLSDLAVQIKLLTSEQNVMLLSDTNMLLNQIIDNSDTPFVYERIGANLRHYMIDEFQDTSALQWSNFKPLIANGLGEGAAGMIVGDVKQSIYRWRNSDWELLNEKVNQDLKNYDVEQQTLDTNWRSDRNVVMFNNAFFRHAAVVLQEKLNLNIGEECVERLRPLTSKIIEAYHDVEQNIRPDASAGRVCIEFVPGERKTEDWHEHSLLRLPRLLENLVERGYKPSDIAFLVRTNKEATEIIHFLLSYKNSSEAKPDFSYDVVGNEGLLISTAASVNFIISALRLAVQPSDVVCRTVMHFEYLRGRKSVLSNPVELCAFAEHPKVSLSRSEIFTDEENASLAQINGLPLYVAVEKLIQTFRINDWEGQTIFLQAFQDIVFCFSNNRSSDLNSFLHWWKDNGGKQVVSMPENQNAFRVMTIHKSKGLDFDVVIVPFCDWELDRTKRGPLLWCEPDKAPFDELPLLPVQYGNKLAQSIFSEDYFEEQMHQYIDNLNAAYVAFTRARHEMICFVPATKDGVVLSPEKINTLAQLLAESLRNIPDWEQYWCDGGAVFEIGKPHSFIAKTTTEHGLIRATMDAYPIAETNNRLGIKVAGASRMENAAVQIEMNYGTIMHEILRATAQKGDEMRVIQQMLFSGKIRVVDLPKIDETLERFWSQPQVEEWFSTDSEVLNETSILLPSGKMYRPDRIVLKGNKATVIDYKFGQEEHSRYLRQMRQYVECLVSMGYRVESWIYYVNLGVLKAC